MLETQFIKNGNVKHKKKVLYDLSGISLHFIQNPLNYKIK